jgi:hypothetical protein
MALFVMQKGEVKERDGFSAKKFPSVPFLFIARVG